MLPEVGHLDLELNLMKTVRINLRGQELLGGVAIREVDRGVAAHECVLGADPQNAYSADFYALFRLLGAT